MRHGQSRRFRRISIVLVLVLGLLGFLPQLAHASTFIGYASSNVGAQTACSGAGSIGGCFTCLAESGLGAKCGSGSVFKAPFAGTITSVTLFTGNVVPNQVEIATFPVGQVPATTSVGPPCNFAGQVCMVVTGGQSFTVQDVEGLSGLTTFTYTTINLAAPPSIVQNQYVSVQFTVTGGSANLLVSLCSSGCNTVIASPVWDSCIDFGVISPLVGTAYSETSVSNCPGNAMATGASFTPTGQTGTTVTVTQCYGNCGSPPITLANTNSTHPINFNQSITLFYPFQSNINGFILNVTTNVAKSYSNGQGIVEAIYVVPSCPLGQIGFTSQCPGYLASGWNVVGNPNKGKLTNGNYHIPIANGQWAAVSITGVFAPLDLNDTNTAIPVSQTQGGGCACPPPAAISTSSVFSSSFKMGLWAWIIGNVVTSQPPTTPGVNACAGLDCILTEATNSFCTNVTTACQTGSALFWVIVLTIISVVTVVWSFSAILPEANVGRMGIGEIAILFFLGWIVIFTSFSLLSIYVLLLVFFVVAALSAKTVRGYVGI